MTPASAPIDTHATDRSPQAPAVEFDDVSLAFDAQVVLDGLSFSVPSGGMRILLGASGAGKSVVLKLALGLLKPDSGRIFIDGQRIDDMSERDLLQLRADIGMLFQESALFDSLTVEENVGYRLTEETDMPGDQVDARVTEVLEFMGLGEHGERMPSQLSGGQRRRVALARAMAAKPGLLLLDDPTTGLDPIIAATVNDEIVKLRDIEHVTSIVVTHQIRDAFYVSRHEAVQTSGNLRIVDHGQSAPDRADFMVLHEGRIRFSGSGTELLAQEDEYLKEFLFMTLPPW